MNLSQEIEQKTSNLDNQLEFNDKMRACLNYMTIIDGRWNKYNKESRINNRHNNKLKRN